MNSLSNQLSSQERSRLRRLMDSVDKAIDAQNTAGEALLEINESRLYRETHKTFEAFVKDTWGFSKPRAYQLIDAGKSSRRLSTIVDSTPEAAKIKTESQHRELKNVSDEQLPIVLEAAAVRAADEGKPITARHIKEAKESIVVDSPATQADEYEDVPDEPDPPKPEPTKAESDKMRAKAIKSYHDSAMRLVDEHHASLPNAKLHDEYHKLFRRAHALMEGWK